MELIFAFRNISTNTLLKFVDEKENIHDYILTVLDKYPYPENYFLIRVNHYKDTLPNFENEILQVIETTDQSTIDLYFYELIKNCDYIRLRIDLNEITKTVNRWNEDLLKSYEKQVENETEEYFKSENRKMNHLEEYETQENNGLISFIAGRKPKTVLRKNYNFYCVEKQPDLIEVKYINDYQVYVSELANYYFDVAYRYIRPHQRSEIKSKFPTSFRIKPVIFVEGEHDISYIKKAAELLDKKELLSKIELRQRGGFKNLDKLWDIFKEDNWETIPQKKLLLYDCDVNKPDDEIGNVYKRTIKYIPKNLISKGIENLFPTQIIKQAIKEKSSFIDIITIRKTIRGKTTSEKKYLVNEDEKKNLCNWICQHGTAHDFIHFYQVFGLISEIVE